MRGRSFAASAVVAALLVGALAAPSQGIEKDWRGLFGGGSGQPLDPREALRIRLPDDIDKATLEWLAVELDGMDVTPILALEGTEIVVRPPRALSGGPHRLALAQYTEANAVIDRGAWTFRVGRAVAYQLRSDASLKAIYRAKADDVPASSLPSNRTTLDGTLRVDASVGAGSWQVGANADGVYTSQPAAGVDHLEGGNWLVAARAGGAGAELGQIDPHGESFIISGFQRRGAALAYADEAQSVQARAFALRTEPVTGFHEGIGLSDPQDRVVGGLVSYRPFAKHWEWLTLTGGYLVGKRNENAGTAVADTQATLSDGSAWSVGFLSSLLGERLRLKGEYAATSYDPDGPGTAAHSEADKAYGGSAVVALLGSGVTVAGGPATWEAGGEYQHVGPSFKSLANAGLPTDLELAKVFTRAGLAGFNAELVAGREHDNVEHDPAVATGKTEMVGLVAGYAPSLSPEGRARAVLGQIRVDLGLQQLRTTTEDLPEGATGANRRTREWTLSVGSSYAALDWRAGYRSRTEEEPAVAGGERRGSGLDGSLTLRWGERVTLGFRGQNTQDRAPGTGVTLTDTLTAADLTAVLVKDRLTAHLAHQWDSRRLSDGAESSLTQTTDLSVDLTLLRAAENRPGVTLNLRGQRQKVDDRVDDARDSTPFQVFLEVNIGWPATLAGTWR
jgi:hypothetical protein